jgi:hypothetical protein
VRELLMPKISNLPHGEEEKPPEESTPPSMVRMHFTLFMKWIDRCINEQGISEKDPPGDPKGISMREGHSITFEQTQEEVIVRAKDIAQELENVKRKLTEDFEEVNQSFVSKCIDPMISQITTLIKDLEEHSGKIEGLQDLLEKAIANVELYDQFHDEKKLKKKIILEAERLVKQSITKDREVLTNYKIQAVESLQLSSDEKEKRLVLVDRFLHPIMIELGSMLEHFPNTNDLQEFFSWKAQIDDRRSSLVELGLLTTDAAIAQFYSKESEELPKSREEEERS